MERSKNITIIFLLAVVLLSPAASAKQASVLLREGLPDRVPFIELFADGEIIAAVLTLATTAIGTAVMPYFSRMVADKEWKNIRNTAKFYFSIIFSFCIRVYTSFHGWQRENRKTYY